MDPVYFIVGGAVLFIAYKTLFAKKVADAGGLDNILKDRLASLEKAEPVNKPNTTVELVSKWQAARKTAEEANCADAVKAFDDAFKLLNAEGTK